MQYSLRCSSSLALTPFWLMMVSMMTAVLPVWRSPMISSRWPRPIGISASIAFRPVCIGSCTDLRGMMPGAFTSTRLRCTLVSGPLPSIGVPSPSTTRPSSPSPTGTSTMEPVRATVSPSRICRSSPKITTPTLSVSRFSAMPRRPAPGNSTISPAMQFCRPNTRAIPSPTDNTWPVSATLASVSNAAICFFRISEISAGRISISGGSLHGVLQALHLRQRMGGGDPGGDDATLVGDQRGKRGDDGMQIAQPAVGGDDAHEIAHRLAEALLLQHRERGTAGLLHVDQRRGEQAAEISAGVDHAAEALHLGHDRIQRMGVFRVRIERGRITIDEAAAGGDGGHGA